jgi:type II secretory pathway pseudopilin PulG
MVQFTMIVIVVTIIVIVVTVIGTVALWQVSAGQRARAATARDEAYRKLAEQAAETQQRVIDDAAELRQRIINIEKMLKEVE